MALLTRQNPAFGWPSASPQWPRGDKSGVGTASSPSSEVWFTAAGGVITEVYYPDVDKPANSAKSTEADSSAESIALV